LNNLSTNKAPEFKKEELFLKVIVEGKKVLYRYSDHHLQRYFFNTDSSKIVQLVYKRYEVTSDKGSKYFDENEMFKQQLYNDVNCQSKSINAFMNVLYKQKSLEKVFLSHNKCNGSVNENYKEKEKKDLFNVRIRPGVNFTSMKIENHVSNKDIDFGAKTNFRFGIEAEYVLPFNRNKWALFIEPTYQYFKGEVNGVYYSPIRTEDYVLDHKSIKLPIGIKHAFFIKDKFNLFLKGAYAFEFVLNSKIMRDISKDLKVSSNGNMVFGIGVEFVEKFSLEFRVGTNKRLLDYSHWKSKYNTSSLIVGYKLF